MCGTGIDIVEVSLQLQSTQHGRHAHLLNAHDAEDNEGNALAQQNTCDIGKECVLYAVCLTHASETLKW